MDKQKLLLIDDDILSRNSLQRILKNKFEVTVFGDGKEALPVFLDQHFDVVLSDVEMPGMSGDEMYFHVKNGNPVDAEKFVFMTGNPSLAIDRELPESRTMSKPLNLERMMEILTEIAGRST